MHLSNQSNRDWGSVYLSEEFDPVDGANRVQALSRGHCLVYAWLRDESGAMAAGTASFSQGWAGPYNMHTVARLSGRGRASTLIAALSKLALKRNTQRCFYKLKKATQGPFGSITAWASRPPGVTTTGANPLRRQPNELRN